MTKSGIGTTLPARDRCNSVKEVRDPLGLIPRSERNTSNQNNVIGLLNTLWVWKSMKELTDCGDVVKASCARTG